MKTVSPFCSWIRVCLGKPLLNGFRIFCLLAGFGNGGIESMAQGTFVFYPVHPFPEGIAQTRSGADREGIERMAKKTVADLMNQGYITASLDTVVYKNDTAFVHIYTGKQFGWGQIRTKDIPAALLNEFGFSRQLQGIIRLGSLREAMESTLSHFESQGYPFAYFFWDSLQVPGDTVSGILRFEKNILIHFDTLALYGDAWVSKNFLYNYLGFRPGQAYSESLFLSMNSKLSRLPFALLQAKPKVFFIGRKAVVVLSLKKRKMDRLDGLIGFAPNTGLPGQTKLLVTGEFHLDFKNLRGSGSGFKLDWQSFKERSQALNAGLNLPYLLNQPVGVDISGDLLKYDTLYTETRYNLGFQYLFSGLNNVRVFYEQKNTNLQFADTFSIRKTGKLSDLTAMRNHQYGFSLSLNTFNNPISPTKGWLAETNLAVNRRQIRKDERISRVRFFDAGTGTWFTVYDQTTLISHQLLMKYLLSAALRMHKNLVLFPEIRGFHFFSPTIYFNELYRFGGNNTLKGFNEQSLFANSVSVINLELRYLLSENSFIKIFGNGAYYQDNSERQGAIKDDVPIGFGGGINLETGSGIFNISVALGRSRYIPIDFKNTKVHFGLVNYF